MTTLKTRPNTGKVRAFIDTISKDSRRQDCTTLLQLFEQVTQQQAVMWGEKIVGFGSYHYKYASGREGDWLLTGFAPGKQQLSIYIMNGFDAYQPLLQKLGKHRTGKSCLYINKLADIDIPILEQIIQCSVADMRSRYC